jgi:hypothetical protein
VLGDMQKHGSPADPIFWSHHAMLDNVWAEWQHRQGDIQDKYKVTMKYKYPFNDDPVFDALNQGFVGNAANGKNAGDPIPMDVNNPISRVFQPSDTMLFLEPKLQDLNNPRWTVADLLNENDMYRSFQFNKARYTGRNQPLNDGLTMV